MIYIYLVGVILLGLGMWATNVAKDPITCNVGITTAVLGFVILAVTAFYGIVLRLT